MAAAIPQLPQEAWDLVLEHYYTDHNIPDLWFTLRHVSQGFKHSVESIFHKTLLPKTFIRFQLGEHWDEDTGRVDLDTEFEFSHLSEDGATAYFKIQADVAEEYRDIIRDQLQSIATLSTFENPQHTVQIKRDLTDGPIPGLSFDFEKFEFGCDWQKLYTIFYAEIQFTSRTSAEWVKNQESVLLGLRAQMEAGRLDMTAMFTQALSGFVGANDSGLKNARRARIQRLYQERDGISWDFESDEDVAEEHAILKRLALEREAANMYSFSDDESEEDDDEEEEDDDNEASEDDEWEDDDGDEHSDAESNNNSIG